MISERAKNGFDLLLRDAVKVSLVASPDDFCEIEPIKEITEMKEKKVVVLTISSYLFRLVTFFYFTLDQNTKEHFAAKLHAQTSEVDDKTYYDAIAEFGNMCSGCLNRDLGKYFPYLGLSTPNILDKNCVDFMSALGGGYVQHYRVSVNSSVKFHASLCVCDYADMDFLLEVNEEDSSSGELELF